MTSLGSPLNASRTKRFSSFSQAHMNLLKDVVASRISHLRPWFLGRCLHMFFVLHKYSFITVNKRSLKIGIRVVRKKMKSKKKCSIANLNIIKCKINRISSDIKFVNSFGFYSKIIQRRKTEMYVHGHEFQVGIHIVRER